jgi:hypothetical protein
MKGVVTAVGNALSGNVIVSKISGFVSSIAGTLSAGFSGLAGKLAGVVRFLIMKSPVKQVLLKEYHLRVDTMGILLALLDSQ